MSVFDVGVVDGIEKFAGIPNIKLKLQELKDAVAWSRANPHRAGPKIPRLIGQALDSPKTMAAGALIGAGVGIGAYRKAKRRENR